MAEKEVGKIATVSGRYYAMDRDKRWDRVQKAYDAITSGTGEFSSSALQAVRSAYGRDENDGFVLPTVIAYEAEHISQEDGVTETEDTEIGLLHACTVPEQAIL